MSLYSLGIDPLTVWKPGANNDPGYEVGQFGISDNGHIYVCAQHTGDSIWPRSVYMLRPNGTSLRINATRLNDDIGCTIFVMPSGITAPDGSGRDPVQGERFWGLVYGRAFVRIRANVNGGVPLYTSSSGTPGSLDDASAGQTRVHGIALDENGTAADGAVLAMIRFPSAT